MNGNALLFDKTSWKYWKYWSTVSLHSDSVNVGDLDTMTAQTLSAWKTTALDDWLHNALKHATS